MTRAASEGVMLLRRIGSLWVAYLKGQLVLALFIGAATWGVGAAIGLPGAFWLGLLAGILETVPTLGPLLAILPAVGIALWQGSTVIPVAHWIFALIVAAAYLLVQQAGNLLVAPYVLGKRLHMHPLLVLAAIVVGALMANIVGAYLAVPLLATAREVVRYLARKRRGLPPFEEEEGHPVASGPRA